MSADTLKGLPKNDEFQRGLARRQRIGRIWGGIFRASNIIAIICLIALAINITNNAFGLVAMRYKIEPATLSEKPLENLSKDELAQIIMAQIPKKLRVLIRDSLSQVNTDVFTTAPLSQVLAGKIYPADAADKNINDLEPEQHLAILTDNLSESDLYEIVMSQIVEPVVAQSWQLIPSLFNRAEIEAEKAEKEPDATLEFRSWVNLNFITNSIASEATVAGLRTALLGTMWVVGICVVFAFPLGIGAAIYLEEYSTKAPYVPSRYNGIFMWQVRLLHALLSRQFWEALIETNIRNLAGVPSIIYGMLGLSLFVYTLGQFTSGSFLGILDSNGRTVLSAGLTLGLVILPVIIINAQEAIRAVPSSFREASYGLGATQWQTISRQVIPAALPGILTGIILSMSRAIGETAPLIVVGASTFIGIDPNGPFSKFTVVPIQIFQWTARPELEFKNVAAAAIIVLMVLLLALNSTAIILRNYYTRKLQG